MCMCVYNLINFIRRIKIAQYWPKNQSITNVLYVNKYVHLVICELHSTNNLVLGEFAQY